MRLEHESEEKFKKEVLNIMKEYLDLKEYKIFFFGSRVINKGSDRSDIDIGIIGKRPVPPIIFSEIEEKIENMPILYTIDMVDFNNVPEKFKKVALQNIEPLN